MAVRPMNIIITGSLLRWIALAFLHALPQYLNELKPGNGGEWSPVRCAARRGESPVLGRLLLSAHDPARF